MRTARLLTVAVLALAGTGCARALRSYDVAPSGLQRSEDELRRMLDTGRAADALQRVNAGDAAPSDPVLHLLYEGVLAYHAGDYERSAAVLDAAGYAADERITKSVSRSALSLVSNDLALPYEPSRTERLMIPYYAALARLRLGDVAGAGVEARRLSFLLQQLRDDDDAVDPSLAATLRYFAGAVFEMRGDAADADVAYRNAAAVDSTLPLPHAARDSAVVIVVLEQGFVAHRVEQGLSVMLHPNEVYAIADGDADLKATALGLVSGRVVQHAAWNADRDRWRRDSLQPYHRGSLFVPAPDDTPLPRKPKRVECREKRRERGDSASLQRVSHDSEADGERQCVEKDDDELPYLLKVAWPVYREGTRTQPARLIAHDTVPFPVRADVSRGVVADFERERALIVARTIARGTAKLALTKGAENSLEEKHEAAGMLIGLLGNIGNVLLERADTRSWHLLPAGISIARVTLPPGEHELNVQIGPRTVPLGDVTLDAGRVRILFHRVF